jgi:YhcH/YjgK/YiaL family protein
MILDSLAQASLYTGLHPGLPAAFSWLREEGTSAPEGIHQIQEGVRAIVQGYRTAPSLSKKWEAHRRNIDLQVVLSGVESVGWAPVSDLVTRVPYDGERDAEFYEPPASPAARFRLESGLFALFFPDDGHQPGVQQEASSMVRKVVFKLEI